MTSAVWIWSVNGASLWASLRAGVLSEAIDRCPNRKLVVQRVNLSPFGWVAEIPYIRFIFFCRGQKSLQYCIMRPNEIPSLLPNIMGCLCLSLSINLQYVTDYHLRFWTTSAFGLTSEDLVLCLRISSIIWDVLDEFYKNSGWCLKLFWLVSKNLNIRDFELMSGILGSCLRIWTNIWDFGHMFQTFC